MDTNQCGADISQRSYERAGKTFDIMLGME
jgi:hypothetical protein